MGRKIARFWPVWPVSIMLLLLMVLMTVFSRTVDNRNKLFMINITLTVFSIFAVMLISERFRSDMGDFLQRMSAGLSPVDKDSVTNIPMPAVMLGYRGEIIWYDPSFLERILGGEECLGSNISRICPDFPMDKIRSSEPFQLCWNDCWYSCCSSTCKGEDQGRFLIFFNDITDLKHTEARYLATRPTVMLIVFDNEDELLKARENERMRVISAVDDIINKWAGVSNGICWADARDKSLIVLEEEAARLLIDQKFTILDDAKSIVAADGTPVTLSIGVGRGGDSIEECELWALQALDMALGRGGDQAVVRDADGYDFYGGTAGSTESQSKVRVRMCATAFADLVEAADNCIVMGHKHSDLDAVGSAIGISSIIRSMTKEVMIAVDRDDSMAVELIDYYSSVSDADDVFIHPTDALDHVRENTLLVVVDTQRIPLLESKELYERCQNVIVIDHHRMMVDHIDNAKLFVHETYASSASEIVSEMASYIAQNAISRFDANALLAGIMLDTKNFVVKTGVRTFEASAFLRRRGADTVEVKGLFDQSLESYIVKSRLVSSATLYKGCAIAYTAETLKDQRINLRIVSSQAADDMLTISGVNASFVLFNYGQEINISGRSFGKVNVQVILEKLGGGGHLTSAGAQLKNTDMNTALEMLHDAIDQMR